MKGEIVVAIAELSFVFTGTRNEVSGKFKEKIGVYKKGTLIVEFDTEEFSEYGIGGFNSILAFIKSAHRRMIELGIKPPYYYDHHYGVMMGRFKRSKLWRKDIDEQLAKYQQALFFQYEHNKRIKVKQDGVSLEIYEPSKRKDSVKVTFRKMDNRRYFVFVSIMFEYTATSNRSFSYTREMGIDSYDILVKQLTEWLDRTYAAIGHVPRFKDLRNGSLNTLDGIKEDVAVVIERLNKGWEI